MTRVVSGRLTDLVLCRMHGRAAEYLDAPSSARPLVVAACRGEATVSDLAERILARTIYSQSASRAAPLRELLQNALDASPRGARIDVRSSPGDGAAIYPGGGDLEIRVTDRGRGMTRRELLEDLLVPFRSSKIGERDAIGEHGIGFLSALEIAPRLEVLSVTAASAFRLRVEPIGAGPPYADFAFSLELVEPAEAALGPDPGSPRTATGTTVRLQLSHPIPHSALADELARVAGFVDPAVARLFFDDLPINAARARMLRVAEVRAGAGLGTIELYAGRGDGVAPVLLVTQRGLLVGAHRDAFGELSLHRELFRALASAGYGLVADLPATVPLNKGRSAVAACAAPAVTAAIVEAFERFLLEDALHDRELLRRVDHRLAQVLDRVVAQALVAEPPSVAPPAEAPPSLKSGPTPPTSRTPTVAAPEEVIRFAGALLDAPLFLSSPFDGAAERRGRHSLRVVLEAFRAGRLRGLTAPPAPATSGRGVAVPMGADLHAPLDELVFLDLADPLPQALWRRVAPARTAAPAEGPPARPLRPMPRVLKGALVAVADLPGAPALIAAIGVLERIDAAISACAGLVPSPISVHQDLYGPEEMAHTDGAGISVNLASPRVRALLEAVLVADDPMAFGGLVDLVLHEKAHVSLASYVPRSTAEHGSCFYRRKDALRRRFLEALDAGEIADPIRWLPPLRADLASTELPSNEALADAFGQAGSPAAPGHPPPAAA